MQEFKADCAAVAESAGPFHSWCGTTYHNGPELVNLPSDEQWLAKLAIRNACVVFLLSFESSIQSSFASAMRVVGNLDSHIQAYVYFRLLNFLQNFLTPESDAYQLAGDIFDEHFDEYGCIHPFVKWCIRE